MIKIAAQLPANYESRLMFLVLWKNGKKWSFCMRSDAGLIVPLHAIPPHGAANNKGFKRQKDALAFAKTNGFPSFAVWNGRKRAYENVDSAYRVEVFARNYRAVSWHPEKASGK